MQETLNVPEPTDELTQWREQLINTVLLAAAIFGLVAVAVGFFLTRIPFLRVFYVGFYVIFVLVVVLRWRSYQMRAWATVGLLYGFGVLALYEDGMGGDGRVFLLALPVIAALLLSDRIGLAALGLSSGTLVLFAALFSTHVLVIPDQDQIIAGNWASWLSGSLVWALMAAVSVASLNYILRRIITSLEKTRQLSRGLQSREETLESQVEERTRALAEQQEALNATVAEQQRLLETVRQISTPVVPLVEGIIVMPLVGVIDSDRAQQVMTSLLEGIQGHNARVALLDITGVPVVDTAVANSLLQATRSAQLLGTEAILVGLRPEVAQTIVTLGVDLSNLITYRDLQQGMEHAMRLVARR